MAPADRYSAPGGAQYDSNTMTVGDGTWDFEKNTFLLPNLQGLNFETMRYNGMANRFSTVAEYHSLIMAHAVIGALVFLLFVPAAVFFARFYTRRPGFAIKYHAMLGIFNILLLTVVFVLGWFAVGPNRSWTNPHHAIGLAIYVMFLLQAIGGYSSPSRTRRHSRRPSGRQAPYSAVGTSVTGLTEDSSQFEPRPADSGHSGPPMPPLPAGAPPIPAPYPASRSRTDSQARTDVVEPAVIPAMPADPQGVLHHESGSESYFSPGGRPHRRPSERRRAEGQRAAAAAAASAGALAAEEEARHRAYTPSGPVSVKVKMHDDKDRNVTLRRLTDDEAAASRRDQRRRRDNSISSIGTGSPSRQRYRRDSSQRRVELAAESAVTDAAPLPPLSPPNPAFAKGRKPKDSAYYSGQPAGSASLAPPEASSIGSPESHGTWSAMSPSPGGAGDKPTASAADNRRRRRQERRRSESRPTGADMFD
ncbi:hypothetical protein BN1708_000806 [Verticillium longisporum]|uniref:Cytochrome b561 domain-containing protein n=1 Tax=Verticillium longisporum TaxID=100787 RepID=A0A0G4M832_VERLO|nr:hypothetical protein BN1708_000806 [Verticillium longisporum]